MVASLRHVESQEELEKHLSRRYTLPVEISPVAPLPKNSAYRGIRALTKTGFKFSLRELLHIVGSKTVNLPSSFEDECVRSAQALLRAVDLQQQHLAFRNDIPSDFQTPRSQEVGVGISCLIAMNILKIPVDSLEPIPKTGMRFDYFGARKGLTCMLESKGTKYRYTQSDQIEHGVEKKQAHHNEGERFDVELICSTAVGIGQQKPRILLGDPITQIGEWLISDQARVFVRLRHYSRLMQFIGATDLARLLYLDSNDLKDSGVVRMDRLKSYVESPLPKDRVTVGKQLFIGSYFNTPFPETGKRYASRRSRTIRRDDFDSRIMMFQGIRDDRLELIRQRRLDDLGLMGPLRPQFRRTTTGERASLLHDGSVQLFALRV
jgi:hypothetical protein